MLPIGLLEKDGLDLPDQHTECAQGRHENRRRKCIGGEVGDLSNGHCCPLALSRYFQLNGRSIHVTTPPHQIGLFKYEKPSPSKPCCLLACCKPYGHCHQRLVFTCIISAKMKCNRIHRTRYLVSRSIGVRVQTNLFRDHKTRA